MGIDFALGAHLQERMWTHTGEQMRCVPEPVFISADVPSWLQTELKAAYALVGIISRAQVRIHHGFADLVHEIEAGQMRDRNSHCC
jgi:hypothetical protein